MNRRAIVEAVDSTGHLVLRLWDGTPSEKPVPRPIVGSSTLGLHHTPVQGAQVALLYDEGLTPYPLASYSAADALGTLPAQAAGETFILGPRGDVLSYATATGQTVLYRNAAGTLSVQADPATNRVNIVASGGLYVNGIAVTVP